MTARSPEPASTGPSVRLRRLLSGRRHSGSLLARAGSDPDAFDELYARYSRMVLVFLTSRVLDAEVALDLTAETFLTVLEKASTFRGTTEPEQEAWLLRVARTQASRYFRRGAAERRALPRFDVTTPAMSTWEVERVEELAGVPALAAGLEAAFDDLAPDQREAVRLRVLSECDYAAIASHQGVTEQVARARVSRGLRRLAVLLHEAGLEDAG